MAENRAYTIADAEARLWLKWRRNIRYTNVYFFFVISVVALALCKALDDGGPAVDLSFVNIVVSAAGVLVIGFAVLAMRGWALVLLRVGQVALLVAGIVCLFPVETYPTQPIPWVLCSDTLFFIIVRVSVLPADLLSLWFARGPVWAEYCSDVRSLDEVRRLGRPG